MGRCIDKCGKVYGREEPVDEPADGTLVAVVVVCGAEW